MLVILVALCSCTGWAQQYNQAKGSVPVILESEYDLTREQEQWYKVNPAYLSNKNAKDQTELYSFYQNKHHMEAYNPLKGNQLKTYGVGANWLHSIDTTATFLGTVTVSKGNQNQVYAQAMIQGDAYGPYRLVHKKTADYTYQNYDVSARYAKAFNRLSTGVYLYYKGDYAYSQTDPRAKDIASWFGIGLGAKYDWAKKHQIGFGAGYEMHSQHIELDVWKGNVKQQFFLLRGFGMYDHQHKDHVFSKKRLYKQNSTSINASIVLWKNNPFSIDFSGDASVSKMKTEEETTINLHELTTHIYRPEVKLNYILSSKWKAQVAFSAELASLKGKENRYNYSKVNEDFSGVYDYVKIGEVSPYVLKQNQYTAGIAMTYRHNSNWLYNFRASYHQENFEEYYKQTLFRSDIQKQTPGLEAKILYQKHKYQFGLTTSFETEKSQKAFTQEDTSYQSMYQEIYLPSFMYQVVDKNYFSVGVDYTYALRNQQQIGVKVVYSKLWGDKSKLKLTTEEYRINVDQVYLNLYYQF